MQYGCMCQMLHCRRAHRVMPGETLPSHNTILTTWSRSTHLHGCREPSSAQQHHVLSPSAHASSDVPGYPAPSDLLAQCSSFAVVSGFSPHDGPPKPGAAPSACEVGAAMIVSVQLGVLGYASNQEHTLAGPPVLLPKLCRSKLSNGLGPFSTSWLVVMDSAKAVALRWSGGAAAPVLLHVLELVVGTRFLSPLHDSPTLSGATQPADPPLDFLKTHKRHSS